MYIKTKADWKNSQSAFSVFPVTDGSGIGDDVTNVGNSRQIHNDALKPAIAGMLEYLTASSHTTNNPLPSDCTAIRAKSTSTRSSSGCR